MLLQLLNFFDDAATDSAKKGNEWIVWVVGGVLIIGMILLMVLPQRKQKKRQEEMMSKLGIGSIVTTIGGIVGEVVELDDKYVWLATGVGEGKTTMQFVRQAIHAIEPAPGSPEAQAAENAEKAKEDEIDEIK